MTGGSKTHGYTIIDEEPVRFSIFHFSRAVVECESSIQPSDKELAD
jgi:hypothetical protein